MILIINIKKLIYTIILIIQIYKPITNITNKPKIL